MRILTISNSPLLEFQGSGYVVLNFVRGLRALGHEVDTFGPADFDPLPNCRRGKNWRLAFGMACCAIGRLSRKRYDLIEFYGGHSWLAVAILRLLAMRRPLLVNHSNGIESYCAETKAHHLSVRENVNWGSAPFRWAYSKADAIVTVSEDERRYVIRAELQDAGHVMAFENALPDEFHGLQVESNRPPLILYCGSWLARKGTRVLGTDMPKVLREFPEYRFKLVGVGDAFRKEDCFPADVLAQIEVIPFISGKAELRREYEAARIAVVPSAYESFGLVTAEAMACGCAVVTTDSGFGADLKSGAEAIIMKTRNSPSLYAALKEMLSDDSLRIKIAAQGWVRVQRLQWKPCVDGLAHVYARWLEERQSLLGSPTFVQAR